MVKHGNGNGQKKEHSGMGTGVITGKLQERRNYKRKKYIYKLIEGEFGKFRLICVSNRR